MICLARLSACLLPCLLLACEAGSPGTSDDQTGGTETGDESSETGANECTPASAMHFTLLDDSLLTNSGTVASPCVVTAADQDPDDPRRWTFAFECMSPVELVLTTDPPFAQAPFEVGEELAGLVSDGMALFELHDAEGHTRMALLDRLGPASELDQPISVDNPFEFEWLPVADCTYSPDTCSDPIPALRIDASAGGEILSLEPEARYGVLAGAEPGESYGLWIGDSFSGDCEGQDLEVLRYAVVALP